MESIQNYGSSNTSDDTTVEHTEIPLNSETLLVDVTTSRFNSAIWYEKVLSKTILLAGLGGIGSYVGFLISRLKPKELYIWDDDKVDMTNTSGQLYSIDDLGRYKAFALNSMMQKYSSYFKCNCFNERFTSEHRCAPISICGFDNMEARKALFTSWKRYITECSNENKKECLFIDGRLAAEEFQVFCIQGDDSYNINRYESEYLFSDEEADETICSYKQTSFCANMIASVMVNLFVNFVSNECDPIIPRDLPFLTHYDATTMYFKTEA